MRNPFDEIKGHVEVSSDSPERLPRVASAIQHQLEEHGAREIRSDLESIRFSGRLFIEWLFNRRLRAQPLNFLRSGEIHFSVSDHRVSIEYRMDYGSGRWFPLALFLWGLPIIAISFVHPITLLAIPIAFVIAWAGAYSRRWDCDAYFQLAATRGLTDAAKKEIEALQSGVPVPHASSPAMG